MPNLQIYAILGALVLAAGIGFKVYFDYSQEQIKTLTTDLQTFKIQNKAQKKAYDRIKHNFAVQSESITKINNEITVIRSEAGQLRKTLARHELDKLASAKPESLKRLANKATKKVFGELEEITKPLEDKQ